jgi:hypothetical protein
MHMHALRLVLHAHMLNVCSATQVLPICRQSQIRGVTPEEEEVNSILDGWVNDRRKTMAGEGTYTDMQLRRCRPAHSDAGLRMLVLPAHAVQPEL